MTTLRSFRSDDLASLVAYNNAELPHVSELTPQTGEELIEMAHDVAVVADDSGILGFVVAFVPGSAYHSLNYRWFDTSFDDFVYVDRIVVVPEAQGRGVGRMLYEHVGALAAQRGCAVTCEVNVVPPNEPSMRFHERLGFSEVGQLGTEQKRVALLAWDVVTYRRDMKRRNTYQNIKATDENNASDAAT